MSSDAEFMALALAEARRAFDEGEVPIGAVAVVDGEVVATAHNTVEADSSVLSHAECKLLAAIGALRRDWRMNGVTVYVTKEPCVMCAGMLVNARVDRVVFALGDPAFGGCGGAVDVSALPGSLWRYETYGGVLAEESRELIREFFREVRSRHKDDGSMDGANTPRQYSTSEEKQGN